MNSIRKWLYKPKKTDKSLLAQFYFADEDLNRVASELDSFDSRKDPERCQALVAQLRACQDKVLTIVQRMMVEAIPYARTSRDFRVKFPDDVVQENLAGQLWFGAECLAAGSSIMNREIESAAMRPLARALTKNLDSLRHILRDQCLVNINEYTERIREALTIFDKLFAEFELSYVSAMVPVKSVKEYETIQEITVLFSETVIRAKSLGYITTDMIDEYDPALMFTIPRLAIVCGLLLFLDGPLNPDSQSWNMSDMFRPFQTLLYKIRELLFTLSVAELSTLERALCSQEEPDFLSSNTPQGSNNTSSSSSTITATSSTTPTTTTTTGVQTDSPVLKKVRPNNDSSCSSLDKLGSDCSDSLSLPEEQRTGCMEVVCQSGRAPGASSPDAVFCESESITVEPQNPSSSLRQERNLNKSDSNDSGLHSDVISTSDSQFTISSSDSNQLLSNSALPSPLLSPSMDEVVELCMEQAESAETSANDNHGSFEEGLKSCDHGKDTECSNSMECAVVEKSAVDSCQTVCGSAAAGKEDDDDEEEENFYTPSSGVSPLHQPSSEGAAVKVPELAASQVKSVAELLTVSDSSVDTGSASHSQRDTVHEQTESVNKYTGYVEGRSDGDTDRTVPSGFDDEDDDKENCGQQMTDLTSSSSSTEDVSRLRAQQLRGVLQKVQAVFAPDESETSEAHAMGSGGSDLSDSPLTDTTLTDLTPQAHLDAMLTGSADLDLTAHNTPHVHFPPRDDTSLALPSQTSDCASVSRCDTNNGATTLKASCHIEPHNQNIPSETGCVSHAGAINLDAICTENAGGCDTSEMNRCDRCTQTPHSAINNDQSSKIHHHHRRQHSNPSTASSASSLSPHRTPKGTTNKKQNKSKKRDDKTESSEAHRSAAANSNSTTQTQTGNVQSVEKSQQVGGGSKKSLGAKTSKTSHKTQTHKFRGLKSQRDAAGSEARLKQYADNWSDCSSHSEQDAKGRKKKEKKLVPNVMETSSGSSCEGSSSTSDCESDQDSCGSSETSSYNSESHDDEEIALAVQAAELANRNQARARFRSSSDMIHRLFVCISGVADQLQTNFAGDLRNILRVVFNLNCSEPVIMEDEKSFRRYRRRGARFFHQQFGQDVPPNRSLRDAPTWIPDDQSPMCMSCKTPFTFVRRRHHCRNCGKIFCGRCSSNAVSLPHFGHPKPVRVCNHCFVFQVNPFAVQARV